MQSRAAETIIESVVLEYVMRWGLEPHYSWVWILTAISSALDFEEATPVLYNKCIKKLEQFILLP